MTPLTVLKSSPDRANELFAALSETTAGAVKTRERLFQELKAEIELLTRLEQDHLLPVLKTHPGTKTIVAKTQARLGGLTALLGRLDETPKAGDDFLAAIAELKAAFQQHLRDEKAALLPKVQKALSDEEIAKVADHIEADRAEVEAAARHDAEVQRAEAQREREAEEARQAAAEAARLKVEAAARHEAEVQRAEAKREREAEAARQAAAKAAQLEVRRLQRKTRAVEREARAAAEAAEAEAELRERAEATAQAATLPVVTALAAVQDGVVEATEMFRSAAPTRAGFASVLQAGRAGANAAQQASREWMNWGQTRAANQVSGIVAFLNCRAPHEVIAVHGELIRKDLELSLATGARFAQIAATSTALAKAVGG